MNRDRFPGIAGSPWARFDGPGGSQMIDTAIDAMTGWMRSGRGANLHGAFEAAAQTERLVATARQTTGALLGADPAAVIFGPSATALVWRLADAVAATLQPGDEIVCTRLDHDANVAPWLAVAERRGATVRFAEPDVETLDLPVGAVAAVLGPHTRWVAVTAASNVVGTVTDIGAITRLAHAAGARVIVDAVHYTPHRRVDARAWGCDALVCSPYKWFGPHLGILALRPELAEELRPAKVRPSPEAGPDKWEQGTLPFESLAGAAAAAAYIVETDPAAVRVHEDALLARMLEGLAGIPGVRLIGEAPDRTPTVLLTVEGRSAWEVATVAARHLVAVGDGMFYAEELARLTGIDAAVRAGALHYTTVAEVDRLVDAIAEAARA